MLASLVQAASDFDYEYSTNIDSTAGAGLIAGLGIFFLVFMLIGLAFFIFNIWMIIDCATKQDSDFPSDNKSLWLVLLIVGLILGFGWIVAIIYYFSVKKKAGKKGGGTTAPPQEPPAEQPKK